MTKPPDPLKPTPPPEFVTNRPGRQTVVTSLAAAAGAFLIAGSLIWTGVVDSSVTPSDAEVAAESAPSASASQPAITTGSSNATTLVDVSQVAARVVDSVVVVEVTIDAPGPFDGAASGSGVIISADGTIVTNAHVIEGATSIAVELTDGSTYPATVLVAASSEDVAILDIDATGLTPIEIGTTSGLEVGDPVIAIGNPLALEGGPSVSTGIVSAMDRVLEDSDTSLTGIIQTDAAITEGSSGGALLDSDGRLIGITTAVGVSSVGVEGIAFAIPVETVSGVLGALNGV